eukprot:TRINITY_DN5961_c0_g1_i1.p1 TRINITY_DN5961_c0_g1~~TRINITY_DN5961_c0_g1_i1.p1  ORF type:complete len:218 (+),score=33.15 TRINITY_DN5961_c0_g1_i1:76-654(+)
MHTQHQGYRVHHTHWRHHIMASFFKLHNETINVHSHFWTAVGLVLTTLWLVVTYPFFLQHADTSDAVLVGAVFFAFVFAFLGSAFYHLSNCHSQRIFILTEKIDYAGVLLFFTFSLMTCCYYGFYCLPHFQLYTASVAAGTIVCVPLSFTTSRKVVRVSVLAFFTLLGTVATLHWVYTEGLDAPDVQLLFPK